MSQFPAPLKQLLPKLTVISISLNLTSPHCTWILSTINIIDQFIKEYLWRLLFPHPCVPILQYLLCKHLVCVININILQISVLKPLLMLFFFPPLSCLCTWLRWTIYRQFTNVYLSPPPIFFEVHTFLLICILTSTLWCLRGHPKSTGPKVNLQSSNTDSLLMFNISEKVTAFNSVLQSETWEFEFASTEPLHSVYSKLCNFHDR